MNTREKVFIYCGGAILAALIVVLGTVLIAGKLGYIDINDWFFPPGGGLGGAYLKLGVSLIAGVSVLIAATYWAKAARRILLRPTPFNTTCPMCGASCTPGHCLT